SLWKQDPSVVVPGLFNPIPNIFGFPPLPTSERPVPAFLRICFMRSRPPVVEPRGGRWFRERDAIGNEVGYSFLSIPCGVRTRKLSCLFLHGKARMDMPSPPRIPSVQCRFPVEGRKRIMAGKLGMGPARRVACDPRRPIAFERPVPIFR